MIISKTYFDFLIKEAISCLDTPICIKYRLVSGDRVVYYKHSGIRILLEKGGK
jgi:hypothetical protein